MGTTSARRAPLLLLAAVTLVFGAACDVVWEPVSQVVLGADDVAVSKALRVQPLSGDLSGDEVAGITIEAQDAGTPPTVSNGADDRARALSDSATLALIGQPDPVDLQLVPTAIPTVPPAPTAVPTVAAAPTPVPVALPPAPVPTQVPVVPLLSPAATAVPQGTSVGQRGQAALATVGFSPASVGYSISFLPGRDGHLGLTFTTERRIEIYIRPSMSTQQIAYIIGHELGHAVDHIRNSGADRQRWMAARGIDARTAWWPTGIGSDLATPAGDFAECFASWSVGSGSHSTWGSCGGQMGLMSELAAG